MNKEVNIFIDSNTVFNDPFWKSEYNKLLLSLQSKNNINIYISEVVRKEILNNYSKSVKEELLPITKGLNKLNKLLQTPIKHQIGSLEKLQKNVNDFYENKFQKNVFVKIQYKNEILPELVERSIKRKKPFSDKKQEFRDGIIWLSYCSYIKENKKENCFFVTNNIHDFWNEEKTDLHSQLKSDNSNIQLYRSIKDLILNEQQLFDIKEEYDFEQWYNSTNFNDNLIQLYIKTNWEHITNELISEINSTRPELYFNNDDIFYFQTWLSKNLIILNNYELEPVTNFASLNIEVTFGAQIEAYLKSNSENQVNSRSIPKNKFLVKLKTKLSLILRKDKPLEVNDIESIKFEDLTGKNT